MELIYFIIGLLILAVSLGFAIKNRHSTQKWIANITVGILFSSIFMVFPTYYYAESGYEGIYQGLYAFASSLFYAFKALAGRADLSQLEAIALEGNMRNAYIVVNYMAFIAAPIMASSLLLSFFGDTLQKIRYTLRFSKKCCVFSELNENSLALAKSIKEEHGRETIIFCNTKEVESKLSEKAKKIGGILLYKSCDAVKPSFRFPNFEYYLISETEDDSIKFAESIIIRENKRNSAHRKPVIVNTFFKTSTKIETLENLASGGKVQLRFINETALFCSDLVFNNPLYDIPDNRKDISVMIVGCGSYGMQMLKTVISAGQIDGYTMKIRVYDVRANHLEDVFYHKCPEIKNLDRDLKFIETDIKTDDFFIKAKAESADATYVCVATSSDDMNLEVSENLYRFFRRNNGFSYTPPIFVRVKDNIITENLEDEKISYLNERKIKLFGTAKSFYANKTLFNTKLEKLALGVHLCYWGQLGEDKNSDDYKNAVKAFYESYYDRKSSMAVAMHFGAKILMCCGEIPKYNDDGRIDDRLLNKYRDIVGYEDDKENINNDKLSAMVKNEHNRWNYYMATEGYQSVSSEDIEKYYSETHSHKDEKLSKSHPCIIPFEELPILDEELNKIEDNYCKENWFRKHKPFDKYDRMIIQKLPAIIRFAYEEEK